MHELPKDLNNSLRSWRGSVHGPTLGHKTSNLEKGPEDYGEKVEADTLSPAQSSLVLHPSASSRSLRQLQRYGRLAQQEEEEEEGVGEVEEDGRHKPQTPQEQRKQPGQQGSKVTISPKVVTRRQPTFQDAPQTPASNKYSLFHHAPKVIDPDPAADRLDDDLTPLEASHFYELIGMTAPTAPGQLPKDLARPHGLYTKIQSHMRYVQIKYRVFDVVTYGFLVLQLLLSAVFIVLGSVQSDDHLAIAILGAISAVVVGVLALMKGQGLPNRLRQSRDDLKNVLFEAEELYWDVAAGKSVLFKDIKKVREDYLRVLQNDRKNHPDSWTSAATHIAGASPSKGGRPTADGAQKV